MLFDEFKKYMWEYEKGSKKISVRTSVLTLESKTFEFKIKQFSGNFDLYFNNKGVLLHSVHKEKRQHHKIFYGYDQSGNLITCMKLLSEKNKLLALSEFEYDEKKRITYENQRELYYHSTEIVTTEHIHTYTDNTEEIFITSDNTLEEDDATVYILYDTSGREIEEKIFRDTEELISWTKNEYDENGKLIIQYSYNENGEIDGITEYTDSENSNGFRRISTDSELIRKQEYTYNERGHWISMVMINEGEPRFIINRIIEYY